MGAKGVQFDVMSYGGDSERYSYISRGSKTTIFDDDAGGASNSGVKG